MRSSIFKQAAEFLQKRKNAKKWLAVFLCLAVVVTTGTLAALKLNGRAMTDETRTLVCSYEVHKHTEDCYKKVNGEKQLVCGYADYVVHVHNDDCYDEDGKLICQLPEVKEHKHTEDCYKTEKVLTCGKEESEGHTHTDDCYKAENVLTCGKEESEGHTHSDACYDEDGNLICGLEESEGHTHGDDCYTEEKVLACGKEEAEAHTHTDDCYTEEKVLACGELELHTHTDECYETLKGVDEDGDGKDDQKLICEIPVLEEHTHTADCFQIVEKTDGDDAAEGDGAENTDPQDSEQEKQTTDEAENTDGTAVYYCGKEEHTHADACYDENGELICGLEEHTHTDACKAAPAEEGTPETETDTPSETTPAAVTEKTEYHLKDDFSYELEDYQLTLHVDGIAVAETVQAEEQSEDQDQSTTEVKPEQEVSGTPDETSETEIRDEAENEPEVKPEISDVVNGDSTEAGEQKTDEADEAEKKEDDTSATGEPAENVDTPTTGDNTAEAGDTPTTGDTTTEAGDTLTTGETAETGDAPTTGEPAETGEDAEEKDLPALTAADVEFTIEQIGEDSDIYAAFEAAMNSDTEESEQEEQETGKKDDTLQLLSVLNLIFRLNGVDLDVSNCKITAEVTPKEAAFDAVEVANANDTENKTETETEAKAEEETEPSLTLTAMQLNGDEANSEVETLNSATVAKSEIKPMSFSLMSGQNNNNVAIALGDPLDINFQVQYYAWLEEMVPGDASNGMRVIDTSGGKLPHNGGGNAVKYIKTEPTNDYKFAGTVGQTYKISTQKNLKPVFEWNEPFVYRERPGFGYIKMVVPEDFEEHYTLKEVWVLKPGKNSTSTDSHDWNVYKDPNKVSLTNHDSGDGSIVVKEGTVIRLVYDQNNDPNVEVKALFNDFDISDGTVINNSNWHNTSAAGINDPFNCNAATKYAFGNQDGTQFGKQTGNRATPGATNVIDKCTFGLVKDNMTIGGSPEFSGNGPKVFGADTQIGKTTYANDYSLNFSRVGDTYTLTSVNGSSTQHLDRFWHVTPYGTSDIAFCNNFWPLDDKTGKDGSFGAKTLFKFYNGKSYGCDDGVSDHNNYFSMQYAVTFKYDEHYVGPLEYLFNGDDDMWVFLDGKLVADMGGVHSAVGEYVNLWDYLNRTTDANKTHTLAVFYTERGASGSSCYTQFTLPSMELIPPTASHGSLEISKAVEGTATAGEQYEFTLELTNDNDTYQYTITDKSGKIVKTDTFNGTLNFELQADQKLFVDNLKLGDNFTVKEKHADGYVPTIKVDGKERELTDGAFTGTVSAPTTVEVAYTNHVHYGLPETGGIGTTKTYALGVLFALAALSALMYTTKRRRKEGN